jgi:predicted Zn-dependent protease
MRMGTPQWLALAGAVVAVVLLLLLPRGPEAPAVDPGEARLAEAVAMVQGASPMAGIQQLLTIVKEEPDNAGAHWHLGLFSVQSGQYDRALERFQQVARLDPEGYPDVWFYLGRAYATLDSTEQAIASLRKYRTLAQDTVILNGVDRFIAELEQELKQ